MRDTTEISIVKEKLRQLVSRFKKAALKRGKANIAEMNKCVDEMEKVLTEHDYSFVWLRTLKLRTLCWLMKIADS